MMRFPVLYIRALEAKRPTSCYKNSLNSVTEFKICSYYDDAVTWDMGSATTIRVVMETFL